MPNHANRLRNSEKKEKPGRKVDPNAPPRYPLRNLHAIAAISGIDLLKTNKLAKIIQ